MSRLVKHKVAKKDVPSFEKLLGFKTTGDIYIQRWDKKTEKKIDKLMEKLYLGNKK